MHCEKNAVFGLCRCKTELSVKAESLPKPAASLPSIASYFHVIVLKVQNWKCTIIEMPSRNLHTSLSQVLVELNALFTSSRFRHLRHFN